MIVPPGTREVFCADALGWMDERKVLAGASVVTSLPDVSELPSLSLSAWQSWFIEAAAKVMSRTPDDGVAVFFQSDIKQDGVWVDKGYLCHQAAAREGMALLWHKVVCRSAPGTVTYGRSAYSHLLCYARTLRQDLAQATADVLPSAGESPWTRGMGVDACAVACRFILSQTSTRTVVDPFCGRGTVLAVANALGLGAVGVELSKKRARQARALKAELVGRTVRLLSARPDSEPPEDG